MYIIDRSKKYSEEYIFDIQRKNKYKVKNETELKKLIDNYPGGL